jgi:hypothetical protein
MERAGKKPEKTMETAHLTEVIRESACVRTSRTAGLLGRP